MRNIQYIARRKTSQVLPARGPWKPVRSVFTLFMLFTVACTEFLSQDVSEVFLAINSPRDSLFITEETITFWWEAQESVEAYRLQLLEGNPDNPYVLIDSLLIDNRLTANLYESRFSWKLRAENEASESGFQERFFVIDTTAPLPATQFYPPDGTVLNKDTDTLSLHFFSRDQKISGISYGVKDSVLLFKESVQGDLLIANFGLAVGEKSVSLSGLIETYLGADTTFFSWQIITTDRAGNVRTNPLQSFSVFGP